MKTIISGSRGITDIAIVREAVKKSGFEISQVLSGTARGVDRLGERWAEENGVPVRKCPADWSKHGKRAGILRNVFMAEEADALIAIWDGKSRGTGHMITVAEVCELKVYVEHVPA